MFPACTDTTNCAECTDDKDKCTKCNAGYYADTDGACQGEYRNA